MMLHHQQSPRSTTSTGVNNVVAADGSSRGSSSPRHSSRGKSLDTDLRNAPSYHAAIMRLLPRPHYRTLISPPSGAPALLNTNTLPTPSQRDCLCDRERRHYRKDWRMEPHPHQHEEHAAPAPLSISTLNVANDASSAPEEPHMPTLGPCFKSGTLYLEVKLAEMFSQHRDTVKDSHRGPDEYCVGVCWQLLGELSRMTTPFTQALSSIYQELGKAINSSYVAAKSNSASPNFQLMPFFVLVGKLGARKAEIALERENLEAQILAHQAEIGHVEQQVKNARENLNVAEGTGKEMESKLKSVLDALEATLEQVRMLQEEMLQLKIKMRKAKVERENALEIQYEQMIRQERYTKLEESYKSMLQELQEAQAEIDIARHQASDSVPKEELGIAKAKADELQKALVELQGKADWQIANVGELTPRPPWEDLLAIRFDHDDPYKPTAELLLDICKENIALTHNISQLQEDCLATQSDIYKTIYAAPPNKSSNKDRQQKTNQPPVTKTSNEDSAKSQKKTQAISSKITEKNSSN